MLAEVSARSAGPRALIHYDAGEPARARGRGARLIAADVRGRDPDNAIIGTYSSRAKRSSARSTKLRGREHGGGHIFNWGNASWRILGINSGTVRVEDAHGQPPGIPFWLGEAPGRTRELSHAVSELRVEMKRGSGRRGQQVLFRNHVAADISPRTLKIFSADSRRRLQILVPVARQSWRLKLLMKRLTNKPSPRPSPFPKGEGERYRRA